MAYPIEIEIVEGQKSSMLNPYEHLELRLLDWAEIKEAYVWVAGVRVFDSPAHSPEELLQQVWAALSDTENLFRMAEEADED